MKQQNKIILLFGFILFIACSNLANKPTGIEIKNFDSKVWKSDSIGCNKKRGELEDTLIANKTELLNRNQDEILTLLGEPNFKNADNTTFFYFIEPGPQCIYVNKNGYDSLEVKKVLIDFDKGKVKDVYSILP